MFETYPTYDRFRTLKRSSPAMRGEDVYALQTALLQMGFDSDLGSAGADGIFGGGTHAAVLKAQEVLGITVDGLAGGGTQQAITKRLSNRARMKEDLPSGLVFGHCMHESSCRLGNYSDQRSDGSYDAGVTQRNTNFHEPVDAFDVEESIELLGRNERKYFNKFAGVNSLRRRWELAAGAWNAPAYASWIARSEGAFGVSAGETKRPSDDARAKLEVYMDSATAFMQL